MNSSIFKTFFISLAVIANTHFAYCQTASILPPAKTTFTDQNGKPLTSGTVDFYIPGTTTRKTTWQDSAESVPNANPVVLDAAGRAIILGDGAYRQVVKDRYGNLVWDQVTSSLGSGSSGGSTIGDGLPVGTILPNSGIIAPVNYQFAYGQSVLRANFPELFAAITVEATVNCVGGSPIVNVADTSFVSIGTVLESICVSGSPTVISKTSSTVTLSANSTVTTSVNGRFFPYGNGNALTTFNLPDLRGNVIAGRCNMGGVDCANLNTTYFSTNPANTPSAINAKGGNQSRTILTQNLPPYTPSGFIGIIDPGHNHTGALNTGAAYNSPGGATTVAGNSTTVTGSSLTGISAIFSGSAQGGTSVPFSIVQPTVTLNYVIKVTPDVNLNSTFGVASIGGMTGIIACGANITCAGNTISVVVSSVNSDAVSYTAPFSGAVTQTQTAKNAKTVSVTDFGADCSAVSDGTTAVRNAILALGAAGGVVEVPNSCMVKLAGNGAQIILINTPVRFRCAGVGSSGFIVDSSTPNTTDVFRIAPAAGSFLYNTGMSSCQVIPNAGTPARHVWNFDTTPGGTTTIPSFLAEDNYFGTFGNYVFFNNTTVPGTNSGGIYTSNFNRNICAGSGSSSAGGCFGGDNWGDSNHISGGLMAGNGYAVNISIFSAGGAGNFVLENANIVSSGMVRLTGGYKAVIKDNTIEQQLYTNTSTNNAVLDILGGAVSTSIIGNQIVVGAGLGNPTPIRLSLATNTSIEGNRLSTAIDQNAIANGGGTNTYIAPSNSYSGPLSAAPSTNDGTAPLIMARYGVNMGIGKESAPQIPLAVSQNTRQALAWPAGTTMGVIGADGTIVTQAIQSNGTATFPQYLGYMSRGTADSPTASQSGDTIGAFGAGGYTGSAFAAQAYLSFSASQNWTGSNRGTYAAISTTPDGSSILGEVARFKQGFMVGTTTDPGAGIVNVSTGYRINNVALSCSNLSDGVAGGCAAVAGQLPATNTNDNAAAGKLGEYVEGILAAGSATALTTNTAKTVTSITLTAGDWDVDAVANILPSLSASITNNAASLSLVNNTLDGTPGRFVQFPMAAVTPGSISMSVPVPSYRFSLSGSTTIYLVTYSTFTNTNFAYGIIRARRAR